MRRRDLIGLIGGGITSWSFAALAQHAATPVIGFLTNNSFEQSRDNLVAFHRGLAKVGFVDGRNLAIEYHWTDGQIEPLDTLAKELVRHRISVIVTVNTPPALAAKAATQTIPIVFNLGANPVELGLVQSFAHPAGNITGAATLNTSLSEKRLELLRELLPGARSIGFLVNPSSAYTESEMNVVQSAARAAGVELSIVQTSNVGEFEQAFKAFATADAVLISGDGLFQGAQIVKTANRAEKPAIYPFRYNASVGGLMSYGINSQENYHLIGEYTGRILNGERPSNLPVQQNTHFQLVINLKTAKALGLNIPPTLLARADEVIE